jgi:hypothetical protein
MVNENDPKRGFSASHAATVTKSDDESTMPWNSQDGTPTPNGACDYFFVETGGTISVNMAGGKVMTKTVPDNHWEWARVTGINATGTSASGITGYWM